MACNSMRLLTCPRCRYISDNRADVYNFTGSPLGHTTADGFTDSESAKDIDVYTMSSGFHIRIQQSPNSAKWHPYLMSILRVNGEVRVTNDVTY